MSTSAFCSASVSHRSCRRSMPYQSSKVSDAWRCAQTSTQSIREIYRFETEPHNNRNMFQQSHLHVVCCWSKGYKTSNTNLASFTYFCFKCSGLRTPPVRSSFDPTKYLGPSDLPTHTQMHIHIHNHIQHSTSDPMLSKHTHTRTQIHRHTDTHSHTHTHGDTRRHIRIHNVIHTHTHSHQRRKSCRVKMWVGTRIVWFRYSRTATRMEVSKIEAGTSRCRRLQGHISLYNFRTNFAHFFWSHRFLNVFPRFRLSL